MANPKIKLPPKVKIAPDDGILELVISTQNKKNLFAKPDDQSIFKIKKIVINNPKTKLVLDGAVSITTPATITVVKQNLNVIVGKNRNF